MTTAIYAFIATKTTYEVALPSLAHSQGEFNRRVKGAFSGLSGGDQPVNCPGPRGIGFDRCDNRRRLVAPEPSPAFEYLEIKPALRVKLLVDHLIESRLEQEITTPIRNDHTSCS